MVKSVALFLVLFASSQVVVGQNAFARTDSRPSERGESTRQLQRGGSRDRGPRPPRPSRPEPTPDDPAPDPGPSPDPDSTPTRFSRPARDGPSEPAPDDGPSPPEPTPDDGPSPSEPAPEPTRRGPTRNDDEGDGDDDSQVTVFYAIGDVPYTETQAEELREQMANIPGDAEFVIHVGDLRSAQGSPPCELSEYTDVAEILRLSPVPVFVLTGDNDWNDCPNVDEGWEYWEQTFVGFEQNWNPSFNIVRQSGREENFSFVLNEALFIGLNIVGGAVHDGDEWSTRLSEQAQWTMDLIAEYDANVRIGRIVIFGHADPTSNHDEFFDPLTSFIRNELRNRTPILYVNGDRHEWLYESSFFGLSSFLRIMLAGETKDPPLRVSVHATGGTSDVASAFVHDRQLS